MRLALIPPVSLIDDIFNTNYQMVLPHLDDEHYTTAYMSARKRGDFLILDNGAAEGETPRFEALMDIANDYMVNEIVVPDVLGDMQQTLKCVEDFGHFITNPSVSYQDGYGFMGVVQGRTMDEIYQCLDLYNSLDWITTIGIPRILLETLDSPESRVGVARFIAENYGPRFSMHLLGTSPRHIRELSRFGADFEAAGVRGVDTSAPYNYANVGKFIDHWDNISRPGEYFHLDAHHFGHVQVKHNLEVMQQWVS